METATPSVIGLYPRVLGPAWHEVHPAVRRFHSDGQAVQATGVFQVRHGTNWIARWAVWLAGLPAAGDEIAVTLAVVPLGDGETWSRTFAKKPMASFQHHRSDGLLAEAMGPMEVRFRLEAVDGAIMYHHGGTALRLGPWRLPLPRWLAPSVSAWEKPQQDPNQIEVLIQVTSPLLGLLVSYGGNVTVAKDAA